MLRALSAAFWDSDLISSRLTLAFGELSCCSGRETPLVGQHIATELLTK